MRRCRGVVGERARAELSACRCRAPQAKLHPQHQTQSIADELKAKQAGALRNFRSNEESKQQARQQQEAARVPRHKEFIMKPGESEDAYVERREESWQSK